VFAVLVEPFFDSIGQTLPSDGIVSHDRFTLLSRHFRKRARFV